MKKKTSKAVELLTKLAVGDDSDKITKFKKDVAKAKIRLEISQQIYNLRSKSGMTQEELANKIGTQKTAISRWERKGCNNFNVATLQKISNACNGKIDIHIIPNKPTRKITRAKQTA